MTSSETPLGAPGVTEEKLLRELDRSIRRCLRERGLDQPIALAAQLGIAPSGARRLLSAESWNVEVALRLVDALQIPVRMHVEESGRECSEQLAS